MNVTRKQLEVLLTAPATDITDDLQDSWDIDSEVDFVRVEWNVHQIGQHYERFIMPDGTIKRYDEDTAEYVEATFEPLTGSCGSHGNTPRTTYRY